MNQQQHPLCLGTLSWVNWVRGTLGAKYLEELPKGVPGDPARCVVARALTWDVDGVRGVNVFGDNITLIVDPRTHGYDRARYMCERPPRVVGEFMRSFDTDGFPDLIEDWRPTARSPMDIEGTVTKKLLDAGYASYLNAMMPPPPPALKALDPLPERPITFKPIDWQAEAKQMEAKAKRIIRAKEPA